MLELALLSPWIIFLFIGVLDFGFYAYSLITLETATRTAAMNNANAGTPNDSATACTIVLNEFSSMVNMNGVSACGTGTPVTVSASQVTGPDNASAAQVSVTYTTPTLIPIPGLLQGQYTITRTVTMKL